MLIKKMSLFVLVFSVSSLAFSNPTCSGKVTRVSMAGNGNVHATVKNGGGTNLTDVVFCSVSTTTGNFKGETCKGLMSLLLSASAMEKNVILWFQSASFTSCEQSWMDLNSIGFYHFRIDG